MAISTNDVALLAGRLAVASLFLPAGIGKLSNIDGFTAMLAGKGVPLPEISAIVGVAAEIAGPIALILGVMPRITALILIAFTLVGSLISHSFWTFADAAQVQQQTQFFKNVAIVGGLLFYFASGAGALTLPRLLGARPAGDATASGSSAQA